MFSALSAQDLVFGVLVIAFIAAITIPNFTQKGSSSDEAEGGD